MTELEKQVLQEYKSACGLRNGSSINQCIRQGKLPSEVEILDKLMEGGETPATLYRVLDARLVNMKDDVIQDSAFLSTSSDAEYAMSSYMSTNTALYIIRNSDLLPSINILKRLGDTNYEAEFILPRNTKFKVLRNKAYQSNQWAQLKADFSLYEVNERSWFGVESIVVYEISPIVFFRPEWTIGRYNAEKHVALMYNLIAGFSYFFEKQSADVIGEILKVGRNGKVNIHKVANSTGIHEESIQSFFNLLIQHGLLVNSIPTKDGIKEYRKQLAAIRLSQPSWVDRTTEEKLPMDTSNAEQQYFDAIDNGKTICSCMFELTYRCSEMCIHCYNPGATRNNQEVSHRGDVQELNLSDYKRIIDEMRGLGLVKVCLTGGDPFSKEFTWELLDYLYEKEISVDIFTNGQRITKDVQRLAEYYPRLVGISIYSGIAEDHDAITRIPGSWNRSLQVVKELSELAVPMNLKCCVMQPNLHSYYMVADLARQYGAKPQFEINITESNDGDICAKQLRLTEDQLQIVLRDNNLALYVGKDAPNYGGVKRDLSLCSCGAGRIGFCLSPNGDMRACVAFTQVYGNLRMQTALDILNNSIGLHEWRKAVVADYEECGKHSYCDYCNLCAGVNYTEHRDFRKPAETNCFMAKCRYNLAKKLMKNYTELTREQFVEALQKLPKGKMNLERLYYNKGINGVSQLVHL